jgi:hypothetical protein
MAGPRFKLGIQLVVLFLAASVTVVGSTIHAQGGSYFNQKLFSFENYNTTCEASASGASVQFASGAVTMSGSSGASGVVCSDFPNTNQSFQLYVPSVVVPQGASAQIYLTTPQYTPYLVVEILNAFTNPGNLTVYMTRYGNGANVLKTAYLTSPSVNAPLTLTFYQGEAEQNISVSLGSQTIVLPYSNPQPLLFNYLQLGASFSSSVTVKFGAPTLYIHSEPTTTTTTTSTTTATTTTTTTGITTVTTTTASVVTTTVRSTTAPPTSTTVKTSASTATTKVQSYTTQTSASSSLTTTSSLSSFPFSPIQTVAVLIVLAAILASAAAYAARKRVAS